MKTILLSVFALTIFFSGYSQGCIALRNLVGFGQFAKPEIDPLTGESTKWLVNINQRYYKAYQTYSGKEALTDAVWQQKTVQTYVLNIGITRILNNGWSFSLDAPISAGSRTAWKPEHATSDSIGHTTHAFGLGDVRITGYKWLWDISKPLRGNVQVGLGLKLANGEYRYSDYFNLNDSVKVLAPVNSVIQPGDGGTGFTTEINAYYSLTKTVSLYFNAFYLFNPRDQNGVSNMYGRTPTANQEKATSNVNSVPDTYTARVGANAEMNNFTFWGGLRIEGTPVHDAIGQSNGQRRAGKVISVDPGVNYKIKNMTIYAFVPFPIFRETKQTVPDQRLTEYTGKYVPSPGGFANYQLFLGVLFKI
jgi:hypothetical protein